MFLEKLIRLIVGAPSFPPTPQIFPPTQATEVGGGKMATSPYGRPLGRPGVRRWLEARPEIKAQVDAAFRAGTPDRKVHAWLRTQGFAFDQPALTSYRKRVG
jgi:hypothetical protein